MSGTKSLHYSDVIVGAMASQINSLTIVYLNVYSLAFLRGIHRWPVNSPHKGPVTRKMFAFDDVIMENMNSRREMGQNIGGTN